MAMTSVCTVTLDTSAPTVALNLETIISARILTAHQTSESVSVRSIRDGEE